MVISEIKNAILEVRETLGILCNQIGPCDTCCNHNGSLQAMLQVQIQQPLLVLLARTGLVERFGCQLLGAF